MKRIILLLLGGIGGTGFAAEASPGLAPADIVARLLLATPSARWSEQLTLSANHCQGPAPALPRTADLRADRHRQRAIE